jgi:hypothetical protein
MFLFTLEQADPETDEVYAQMTLQPVNKVGYMFNPRICYCIPALVNIPKIVSFASSAV